MTVGEKIQTLRLSKNLTQKELAKLSGISLAAIRKYETDEREPKAEYLNKIAQALEVHTTVLLSDSTIKEKYSTIGDVFYLIKIIDDLVGINIVGNKDENGNYDKNSISFKLDNSELNEVIANWGDIRNDYFKDVEKVLKKDYSDLDINSLKTKEILDILNFNSTKKYLEDLELMIAQKATNPLEDNE